MYYQVLIETELKTLYELDIKEKDTLMRDIVQPYLDNKEFIVDGYNINQSKIRRLKIMTTEKSVYMLSKYENDNIEPGIIMYISPQDILTYDKYTKDITREILRGANESGSKNLSNTKDILNLDMSSVFIVHGHDELAENQVARFVEKLGLKSIILHEKASAGKTIIEKIEEYSNVGFGIVIYTACDLGNNKDNVENIESLNPRARQNVVFEHGYLIGKIGRENVCALVKGEVEKPNDISGIVYVNMDEGEAWQLKIAKEMIKAGYSIDLNNLILQ